MAVTAADVPSIYDLVISNGVTTAGFVFANTIDQSLPFRVQRAAYGYTQTFVDRQNVSGNYGDNQQDFWLSATQRDWGFGEQQKFFRAADSASAGRYWAGSNIDVSTPGQAVLAQSLSSATFAAAVRACARDTNGQKVITASATKLYTIDAAGTITDNGVHGVGATPSKFGLACDGGSNYVTTLNVGTVGVRRWSGAAYSTFSITAADSIAFLNNTLYGYRSTSGDFGRWDSAGAWTTLFTWRQAEGTAFLPGVAGAAILEPYGGKMLILFPYGQTGCELWIYDGSGVSLLQVFPPNFVGADVEVLYGIAFVSGSFFKGAATTTQYNRPAILYYANGNVGELWKAADYSSTASSDAFAGPHPAMVSAAGKLYFTDDTMNTLLAYNPATGGVSTIGSYTGGGTDARLAATGYTILHTRNATGGYYYGNNAYPTSGYLQTSQFDFDNSFSKVFRGVTLEWAAATDGNGGTVDIAYQLDGAGGTYTNLQTTAVSGTEYTFPANTTGRSISIRVTVNKGTSTAGPTLKKIKVRAIPVYQSYRHDEFILDCTGRDGKTAVRLRNDQDSTLDGQSMVDTLRTFATSTTPLTITDRSGTFTGIIEPQTVDIIETRPEEYLVRIGVREV